MNLHHNVFCGFACLIFAFVSVRSEEPGDLKSNDFLKVLREYQARYSEPEISDYNRELPSEYDNDISQVPAYSPDLDRPVYEAKRGVLKYGDIDYKRFGFMGSRGKRRDATRLLRNLNDLLTVYNNKLKRALGRYQMEPYTRTNEGDEFKNKRQPHFGFHGSRG